MPLKGFLTAPEASEEFNIAKPRLLRLLNKGVIKGRKVGWMWFVKRSVMEEYVEGLKAKESSKTVNPGAGLPEIDVVPQKSG